MPWTLEEICGWTETGTPCMDHVDSPARVWPQSPLDGLRVSRVLIIQVSLPHWIASGLLLSGFSPPTRAALGGLPC